jgi:predicted DNA-binding transcriptional regulator AlpA
VNDRIITAKEIAKDLGCSMLTVYRLMNGTVKGCEPLPHLPLGRKKVVRQSSYEAWKSRIEKNAIIAPEKELAAVGA